MNRKQKIMLARILTAAVLMVAFYWLPFSGWARFGFYMVPYLIIGYDILLKAWHGIVNRQPFDEGFLMTVATVGAIALALYEDGDYTEAIAVMLFYQVGEWFQGYAVGKSRKSIADLMDIRPDYANVEDEAGNLVQTDPDEVEIGTVIVVQPGEKVPIDGIITEGTSALDTAALTGESLPRDCSVGDEVKSGCINLSGLLKIRTTCEFDESTAAKILDLVENASSRKSRSEAFITRFARVYTPAVVGAALALAILPPLARLGLGLAPVWGTWLYRALIFLVISCPCALVVSIPLSFFAGLGGASRAGVLIKGSNYMEALADVSVACFDKTGTLTRGSFEVTGVHHASMSDQDLLFYAAHAEAASSHPIAKSLRAACQTPIDRSRVSAVEERSGRGVVATVDGHRVACGNDRLMQEEGCPSMACHIPGTIIHVAIDGAYAGHIVISDVVKPSAAEAVQLLHEAGVKKVVMLTGDALPVAQAVAGQLGVDEVRAQLMPADKVAAVEDFISGAQGRERVAFVGDGINDAPVLTRADVGIGMGAMGSDAAIEAADVVLMDDDPRKVSGAVRIARKCMGIVRFNIVFAIGVKLTCLVLGAVGLANMWLAIFADVGVLILCVLNAMRCLHLGKLMPAAWQGPSLTRTQAA